MRDSKLNFSNRDSYDKAVTNSSYDNMQTTPQPASRTQIPSQELEQNNQIQNSAQTTARPNYIRSKSNIIGGSKIGPLYDQSENIFINTKNQESDINNIQYSNDNNHNQQNQNHSTQTQTHQTRNQTQNEKIYAYPITKVQSQPQHHNQSLNYLDQSHFEIDFPEPILPNGSGKLKNTDHRTENKENNSREEIDNINSSNSVSQEISNRKNEKPQKPKKKKSDLSLSSITAKSARKKVGKDRDKTFCNFSGRNSTPTTPKLLHSKSNDFIIHRKSLTPSSSTCQPSGNFKGHIKEIDNNFVIFEGDHQDQESKVGSNNNQNSNSNHNNNNSNHNHFRNRNLTVPTNLSRENSFKLDDLTKLSQLNLNRNSVGKETITNFYESDNSITFKGREDV